MIETLLKKKEFTLTLCLILLFIISLASIKLIPLEVSPQEQTPQFLFVKVSTPKEAAPERTEAIAATAIEGVLKTIPGIKEYTLKSQGKNVSASLVLFPEINLDLTTVMINESLQPLVESQIISENNLSIMRLNPDASAIIRLSITHQVDLSDHELDWINKELRPKLESIPEVSKVEVQGFEPVYLEQSAKISSIEGRKLKLGELSNLYQNKSFQISLGTAADVPIRGKLELGTVEGFLSQGLTAQSAQRLKDLAPVKAADAAQGNLTLTNGKSAAFIEIFQKERTDPFELEKNVTNVITILKNKEDTPKIKIEWVMNRVDELRGALDDVKNSLWQSILITFLVVFFFLKKWRRTLFICASIPLTLVLTILGMFIVGKNLNIVTLSGLILGIGMVVDNVILVADRIIELKDEGHDLSSAMSKSAEECFPALTMATLTNGIIFLPVLFSQSDDSFTGLLKAFQAPILCTLISSVIVAVLMVPIASKWLPNILQSNASDQPSEKTIQIFSKIYEYKGQLAFLAVLFVLFIGERVSQLPQTDIDPPADSWVNVNLNFSEENTVAEKQKQFDELQKQLLESRATILYRTLGAQFSANGSSAQFIFYPFSGSNIDQETQELGKRIQEWLKPIRLLPGMSFETSFNSDQESNTVKRKFTFQGLHTLGLKQLIHELKPRILEIPGVTEVVDQEQKNGIKELELRINPVQMAQYEMKIDQVSAAISAILKNVSVGPLKTKNGNTSITLKIKPDQGDRWTLEELKKINIDSPSGKKISLGSIVQISENSKFNSVKRFMGKSTMFIEVMFDESITASERTSAIRKVSELIHSMNFPAGYGLERPNQEEAIDEMQNEMVFMIGLSSLLIYLILGGSLNSIFLPFVVLLSIPFSILSGLSGLLLLQMDLDVMARLSLVILVGVGVNNAILLIDMIESLKTRGFAIQEAIIMGNARRFKAVMMTTGIQVIGVIPVALGNSKLMGIPYASLGIVIIFGMLISTLLTFAVLPFTYELANRLDQSLNPASKRQKSSPPEEGRYLTEPKV